MEATGDRKDIVAGLIYLVCGAVGMGVGAGYPLGTLGRIGPGMFPTAVGALLAAVGVAVLLPALRRRVPRERLFGELRQLLFIALGIVCFGLAVEPLGIVVATVATTLLVTLSSSQFKAVPALLLALVLASAMPLLFVGLLGMPLKVLP